MSHARNFANHELFALLAAGWIWTSPVIAATQAQAGRGELLYSSAAWERGRNADGGAIAAAEDPEPLRLAQAPNPPGAGEVAAAAAPRPGQGESALIDAATAQPQERNPAPAPAGAPAPIPSTEPATAAKSTAADRPATPGTDFTLWTIPPIRWGGYSSIDLRHLTAQGQPPRAQLVEQVNFKAASYIWQPWIAQVSGELNLLTSQERVAGAAGSGIKSTTVTGGGQLALFPMSRFPFTASYSETDSRTSGELTNNPYTSRRYGLTQSYAPLAGRSNYRLAYDRSELTSDAFGTDKTQALSGSMNWSNASNTLSANGNRYTNTRSNSGDASSLNTVNVNHSYRPSTTFAVDSLANYSATQYHLVSDRLATDFRSRLLQLNSFATWRPAENSPLFVTGGLRVYENSASVNGAGADSRTISANAAATYALSRNTRLSGAGIVTQTSSEGGSTYVTSQTGGIDHNSDVIKFGEYSYGWNTGANVGNQTGAESSKQNLGARIGHQANRNIALGDGSALFFNASQSYSLLYDTLLSTSQTLVHNAGASWSRRLGESGTGLLSLNGSDTRTTGYTAQHFQLVNLQATGQIQLNRWSSAGANMTIQATRQSAATPYLTSTPATRADRFDISTAGSLSYQHMRVFDVARLRYYGLLNINHYQNRTRFEGDINAPIERVNWSFEQRLDYNIGRLEARLSMQVAEIEGRTNSMIFFRVLRQFGLW